MQVDTPRNCDTIPGMKLMSTKELAAILRISVRHCQHLLARGQITGASHVGRWWAIHDIEAAIASARARCTIPGRKPKAGS